MKNGLVLVPQMGGHSDKFLETDKERLLDTHSVSQCFCGLNFSLIGVANPNALKFVVVANFLPTQGASMWKCEPCRWFRSD